MERYFTSVQDLIDRIYETEAFVSSDACRTASMEEWQARQQALFEDILPEHYPESDMEPAHAAARFGADWGRILAALLYEVRTMIPFAYESNRAAMDRRRALFESFRALLQTDGTLPDAAEGIALFRDYYETHMEEERRHLFYQQLAEEENFAARLIRTADLSDPRYLYRFGFYVSDNEIRTAQHLNRFSEDAIDRMARTLVDGYCDGFAVTGRDLSLKKSVRIYHDLGFERMVKRVMELFTERGLRSMVVRGYAGVFFSPNDMPAGGFLGSRIMDQADYDHKDDVALIMDADFQEKRLQAYRAAFETYRAEARVYGGPALIETFGREPFVPVQKPEAVRLSAEQQKLVSEFRVRAGLLQNEFIPGDERSFSIISYPVPEIGEPYEEIFDGVVRINTLDASLYRKVQQTIIDVLDRGAYCVVRGMNGNRTDMKVMLRPLTDPARETNFENCVADVNIPVGEVFTSPALTGTEGTLHVSGVYLDELYYKDLTFTFRDGMVTDYGCGNFATAEEGRSYIRENILYNHETLPVGEFAIGTNTTAYVFARRYHIEQKLPILIAEKTGPHFALGDTCYSHEEDVVTHNPDGRRIVAKDNEVSVRRHTEPEKAYFSCHTDITIPYDELGCLASVAPDGTETPIIENGRFVLPGTEALNEALLSD